MALIEDQTFVPAPGLKSPHLQSLLASTSARRWVVKRKFPELLDVSEKKLIECSDGVRLEGHWSPKEDATATMVLVSGWEGCHESTYLLSLAAQLHANGCNVFRLNMRDHGETYHLNEGAFHTWRLQEIIDGIQYAIDTLSPDLPVFLSAFSIGGNIITRCLAAADLNIQHAITFNAPIQPKHVLERLDGSPYRGYFVKNWKYSLLQKQLAFPELYNFDEVQKMDTVKALCDFMIASGHGPCDTLDEYLDGYSIKPETIKNIKTPLTMVTAKDDPIIPVEDYLALPESEYVDIVVTQYGGHCGFITSLTKPTYVYSVVSKIMQAKLESMNSEYRGVVPEAPVIENL